GIYWTMCLPNKKANSTKALPVRILIPGNPHERYDFDVILQMQHLGIEFKRIEIRPYELSEEAWCNLFDLSINEPLGISLYRAVQSLKEKGMFSIPDIIAEIKNDKFSQDKTQEALINRLESLNRLGIFSVKTEDSEENIFNPEKINVLDLSVLEPSAFGLRNLLLDILSRHLFKENILNKKRHDLELPCEMKRIWLLLDEAHQFAPQGQKTLAKEILIRWVKEGRQPGLSCVFVTQQPSSLDNEIISQCDLIITHKITNVEDVLTVNKLTQAYMPSELKLLIHNLKRPGEAVLIDDSKESVSMVKIRPRLTQHGGEEC
ncbi:MAG: hypothetical protein COV72_06590, partial [Candidatus Omnitrophica bacterium CG11_big_fil_rev_8_21_14_0_20_42_13]